MTLPELLISITVMGMLVTVLSTAVIVTLRAHDGTEGRTNVAQAEQSVNLWMPSDLASANEVDTDPSASPCAAPTCPVGIDLRQGSNVLMLTWYVDTSRSDGTLTNVSYHFTPSGDGSTYVLKRIECSRAYTKDASGTPTMQGGWTCDEMVLLHDLPGPPADEFGNPVAFVPGVTSPIWVIRVSEPLAPEVVAGAGDDGPIADVTAWKNANRVIVTIDGGGEVAGAGGGLNQMSITAGGTTRQEIGADSLLGSPSFIAAKSRCGGPITLVVDESQSIAGNIDKVQAAVKEFVGALRGTPVQIQIITFTEYSRVLGGAPGVWRPEFVDMTDTAKANALYNAISDPSTGIKNGGAGGSGHTNWEEALFRVGYNPDGTMDVAHLPHTVVFFTDGIPTYDRNTYKTAPSTKAPVGQLGTGTTEFGLLNRSAWPSGSTYDYQAARYHQVAFNRAEWIAAQLRGKTKLIAVGVSDFTTSNTSQWRASPSNTTAVNKLNERILTDLIKGVGNTAQKAELNAAGTEYINPDTAELYIPQTWSMLPAALRAVALGQCAGTLTVQTRSAVPNAEGKYEYLDRPVRYLAQKVTNADGSVSKEQSKYIETNLQFTARTFDLEVPGGSYVDVEMVPMDFSDLAARGYTTNHWECTTAGNAVSPLPTVATSNPNFSGFAVRINANKAVSCTHYVNPPAGG